jgi:hypothetical protein
MEHTGKYKRESHRHDGVKDVITQAGAGLLGLVTMGMIDGGVEAATVAERLQEAALVEARVFPLRVDGDDDVDMLLAACVQICYMDSEQISLFQSSSELVCALEARAWTPEVGGRARESRPA